MEGTDQSRMVNHDQDLNLPLGLYVSPISGFTNTGEEKELKLSLLQH